MSAQFSIQQLPNTSWNEVEGLEDLARTYERGGDIFATVFLDPIEDPNEIESFDLLIQFVSRSFTFRGSITNQCNLDPNVKYTVNTSLNQGNTTEVNTGEPGKWALAQDNETKDYYLSFYLEKVRLEIFPTRFQTQGQDPKRIYGAVLTKPYDCAHASEKLPAIKKPAAEDKKADPASTSKPANQTKSSSKATKTLSPVSIVVGYTVEAAKQFDEAKMKSMLASVEVDLAKSLENAGVNVGLTSDQQVRFEIRTELINTNKSTDDLTEVEAVVLLSHHESRFKEMHEKRAGANLVFLLIGGFQGYHFKEFAVVGVHGLNKGVFQHELGHMVATMGGSKPVPIHHGLFDIGGSGHCKWSTLMDPGSVNRINCWSSQNLQTSIEQGITISATGNDNFVADYFHLAAEKMLQLGQ